MSAILLHIACHFSALVAPRSKTCFPALAIIPLIALAGLFGTSVLAQDLHEKHHDLGQIERMARQALEAQHAERDVAITLRPPHSSLRLIPCRDQPYIEVPEQVGRVTVAVGCEAPQRWKIHLRAEVKLYDHAVVTLHALVRNTRLGPEDVALRRVEVTNEQRYLRDVQDVLDMRLRRGVRAGTLVSANMLVRPPLIERGERVTARVRQDGLRISVVAEALENGARGDMVRMRNLGSGRIIEGVVVERGVVEILGLGD